MIKFKFNKERLEYPEWISFYPKKCYFRFELESHAYFDPRPQLNTNITSVLVLIIIFYSLFTLTIGWFHLLLIPFLFFGWGKIFLKLPFDTGKEDAESPCYGFYMAHHNTVPGKLNIPNYFVWEWGNYRSWEMPWAYTWVRTSILLDDFTWEHEVKGDKKSFYRDEWKNKQFVIDYSYTDKYDGEIIPTKVYIDEREWRQHWLKWTSLFAKTVRSIDVHFSKEVGGGKGSWKGGVLGCGYNMKKNETALECIKRMEKERVFK